MDYSRADPHLSEQLTWGKHLPYLQQMEEGRAGEFCGVAHKINVALWAAESIGFIF